MGRTRWRRRAVAAVLGAAAAVAAIGSSTASAQAGPVVEAVVEQPYAADSGDSCRYGSTKGSLFWTVGPFVGPSTVGVAGSLVDRPAPDEPTVCRDDRRFSVVMVTAYVGDVAVDRQQVRTDNNLVDYRVRLVNDVNAALIERVTVVVCRHPVEVGIPGYCGKRLEFKSPVS